ncbi:MAG: chemotaxis protein CheR [Deltaproteobacteria bacterium]|nr:MAG: chemotaxis protein CheR [Deltaproteobacteria bacterium]
MRDVECVEFLRWALPRLGMRWRGFRRVRRQVCRRVDRRLRELGLADAAAYRSHLESNPGEWTVLAGLCRVTISRFYRDRAVFDALRDDVLPQLCAGARAEPPRTLRCWSAGCGSGEEAYSLSMLFRLCLAPRFPELRLRVRATDIDDAVLARARRGVFAAGALRELPEDWRARAFDETDAGWRIRPAFRAPIEFFREDVCAPRPDPEDRFHLVLCRNLAFTYFETDLQRQVLGRLAERIRPGGALVLGIHESLPPDAPGFAPWHARLRIFRRLGAATRGSESA